jgi:SAM-dependent methyltransferase
MPALICRRSFPISLPSGSETIRMIGQMKLGSRVLLAVFSAILSLELLDAAHQLLIIEKFSDIVRYLGVTAVAVFLFVPFFGAMGWNRARAVHESLVGTTEKHLERLTSKPVLWNVVFAALALFLEMSLIRWTSYIWIANYRNLVLLGSFLGLGLGFMNGRRRPGFIPYLLPIIGLQYLQFRLIIEVDQMPGTFSSFMPSVMGQVFISPYWQFLLVVITSFAPGQLVGFFLAKRGDLVGYGANLGGSLLGVILAYVLAAMWTSPSIWLIVITLIIFWAFPGASSVLAALALAFTLQLSNFAAPVEELVVYSPYQRLALRNQGFGHKLGDGRLAVTSNSVYYQSFPTIDTRRVDPKQDVQLRIPNADLGPVRNQLRGTKVLALGVGAGANVTQLLRAGVSSVVAVDIDPVIIHFGKTLNGDRPYSDPRVEVVVDDARSYLRDSKEKFDFIFFYWIDSHPGSTNSAGFRLDSFVYTRECFEQCKERLKPGGRLLLYAWMSPEARLKILHTMNQAFGTKIQTYRVRPYEYQWLFAVGEGFEADPGSIAIPTELPDASAARILTDDWPFLYLGDGTSWTQFLKFIAFIICVSAVGIAMTTSSKESEPRDVRSLIVFFLFGVSFMLVETTLIMQAALIFGNTWKVVGYVVIAILMMAFAGNVLVQRRILPLHPFLYGSCLLITLILLWFFRSKELFFTLRNMPYASFQFIVLASLPVFFSSIIFSMLLNGFPAVNQALGSNLLGAMVGGCLEYVAMGIGYRALTLAIPIIYLLAMALHGVRQRKVGVIETSAPHQSLRS